jgi:hypothetical protein
LYQSILTDASLYELLLRLDEDLAAEARQKGCLCHGRLHSARYRRKPRGVPERLQEDYSVRQSFCCEKEGCRKRTTPPSFRFLSRRVYVSAVVVLLTALRHGATPARMAALRQIAGVSRRTVERWRQWWLRDFVRTVFWKSACGRFASPLDLKSLPLSLLDVFAEQAAKVKTVALLRFILPLTTSSTAQET